MEFGKIKRKTKQVNSKPRSTSNLFHLYYTNTLSHVATKIYYSLHQLQDINEITTDQNCN